MIEETKNKIRSAAQRQNNESYLSWIKDWKDHKVSGITDSKYCNLKTYIRRYLFEKYHNKCSRCNWGEKNPFTGKIPLEIHHLDGDSFNSWEENLELLCPNCHSLTSTFRWLNKGKSTRKFRLQ